MALILHLETATKNCSVALSEGDRLLAHISEAGTDYVHAEKLHLFIDYVLKTAAKTPADLAAVCVSEGPGSYTGLRIGVAAAKGLCFGLNIPLMAIPTTKILWAAAKNMKPDVVVALIDARRLEAYATVFDGSGKILEPLQSHILTPESFKAYAGKNVVLIGDAAQKAAEQIDWQPAQVIQNFPDAQFMPGLAAAAFHAHAFVDLAYFEPAYFKDFQAGAPRKLV